MSINVKKYTKDQMAKMVEDAVERCESLKSENADLIEKVKKEMAEKIALRNDLMAMTHSHENLKAKNVVLTEQISQMNGEAITRANEIANLKADLDSAKNSAQCLNDQGQQYWRAWQASKREVADLKNKLNDTEAALKRANAELTHSVADKNTLRDYITKMVDRAAFECRRADYAESHPWWDLWVRIKRKLKME